MRAVLGRGGTRGAIVGPRAPLLALHDFQILVELFVRGLQPRELGELLLLDRQRADLLLVGRALRFVGVVAVVAVPRPFLRRASGALR